MILRFVDLRQRENSEPRIESLRDLMNTACAACRIPKKISSISVARSNPLPVLSPEFWVLGSLLRCLARPPNPHLSLISLLP
jgi:hypothetical protein